MSSNVCFTELPHLAKDKDSIREAFHRDGYVQFNVNPSAVEFGRVVSAIWGEYTKTLCKALVSHAMLSPPPP
jgi:hypothetical protein